MAEKKRQEMSDTQRILAVCESHRLVRAKELRAEGVSAVAISRCLTNGQIRKVGRGLYESARPDLEVDFNIQLAEVAKLYPRSRICLLSALAFYQVTDVLPPAIWVAISARGWQPTSKYPPLRCVRFREPYYSGGLTMQSISGIDVPMYSIEKTLADAFRNPKLVERSVAIAALKESLEQGITTPAKVAEAAMQYGAWKKVEPCLEVITVCGIGN